jgi:urease accessory protein
MGSLFFVAGAPLQRARREAALDGARAIIANGPLARTAAATSPAPRVMVVRVLAPLVEPAIQLLKQVRAQWRAQLWELEPNTPRIWSM